MGIREYSDTHLPPIVVVGANHKTLSIEGRETLSGIGNTRESVADLAKRTGLASLTILSTCNRFECVTVADDGGAALKAELLSHAQGTVSEKDIFVKEGRAAIEHVFRVASSLDSMVLGEAQILGQVKDAYRISMEAGTVGKVLHHLFQYSFRVAKAVRAETTIAEKGVSVSYVAVKLAEQIFDGLKGRRVLLIGSGEMAELAVLHLRANGCEEIVIANRTRSRAVALAERVSGRVIGLDEVVSAIAQVDVVIGSIRTETPILRHAQIKNLRGRSVFFIDCGLPRNFHPEIASLDGIYLYNIDDLQSVARDNLELRKEAANDADLIVEFGVYRFELWLQRVAREPYLLDFRNYLFDLCKEELSNGSDGEQAATIPVGVQDKMVERIVERASLGFDRVLAAFDGREELSVFGEPSDRFEY